MTDRDRAVSDRVAALPPDRRALLERALLERRRKRIQGIVPRDPMDRPVLSSSQHRLWFFDQLTPGAPTYNAIVALRVRGPLDLDVVEQALRIVVARHEVLRTALVLDGDTAVQRPLDDWEFGIDRRRVDAASDSDHVVS